MIRSISDVVASARANVCRSPSLTLTEQKGGKEDDYDDIGGGSSSSSDDSPFNKRGHKSFLRGSFERMPIQQQQRNGDTAVSDTHHHRAVTRCGSSNHRNVTRPRDVKSKKFHKVLRVSPITSPTTSPSSTTGFLLPNLSSPV